MSTVLEKWKTLRDLLDSGELEVHKSAQGSVAAGPRLRKCLRELKAAVSELVKESRVVDSALRDARKAERAAKKAAKSK